MNRVLQPRPLVVLGLNVWMGTSGAHPDLNELDEEPRLTERQNTEKNSCAERGTSLIRKRTPLGPYSRP